MSPQLIGELVKQGLLGTLLAIALFVIYQLYRAREADRVRHAGVLEAANNARIAEAIAAQQKLAAQAQEYSEQLLELTRGSVAAITSSANAALAVKESVGEVRGALAEHTESLRDYLAERRLPPSRR